MHAARQVCFGERRQHFAGLAQAATHRVHQPVEVGRDAGDILVGLAGGEALRQVALQRRLDGAVEPVLELLHQARPFGCLGVPGPFILVHFGDADAVLLEHLHCRRHLADLILLADIGNLDRQVALGQAAHDAGDTSQRARDIAGGDNRSRDHAEQQTENSRSGNGGYQQALEGVQVGICSGELLLVLLHYRVDFSLEGFPIGAVGLVVALRVGLYRIDFAEPRRLRTEAAELHGSGLEILEGSRLRRWDQRLPCGYMRIDLVEGCHDTLTKRLGLLDSIRGINTAGIHHHGGDQPIQALAREGPRGSVLKLLYLLFEAHREISSNAANRAYHHAHDDNDDEHSGLDSHSATPWKQPGCRANRQQPIRIGLY